MDLSVVAHKADLSAIFAADSAACNFDTPFDDEGRQSPHDAVAIGQLVNAHIRKLCSLWLAFENDDDRLGPAQASRGVSGPVVPPDAWRGIAH